MKTQNNSIREQQNLNQYAHPHMSNPLKAFTEHIRFATQETKPYCIECIELSLLCAEVSSFRVVTQCFLASTNEKSSFLCTTVLVYSCIFLATIIYYIYSVHECVRRKKVSVWSIKLLSVFSL